MAVWLIVPIAVRLPLHRSFRHHVKLCPWFPGDSEDNLCDILSRSMVARGKPAIKVWIYVRHRALPI
jgi:hypothetical protein